MASTHNRKDGAMTYRERRENKAQRLTEWAEKREAKAQAASDTAHRISDMIPMGQPVLMGHHSQGRHMRDIRRIDNAMRATVENAEKAREMRSRAENIKSAADRAIYSDDVDAIDRLEAKLAELEARREEMKQRNAEYRKAHKAELKALSAYGRSQAMPHPSYELTNLGGNISRTRQRLEQMRNA